MGCSERAAWRRFFSTARFFRRHRHTRRYLLAIVSLQIWACSSGSRPIVPAEDPDDIDDGDVSPSSNRERGSTAPDGADDLAAVVTDETDAPAPVGDSRPERASSAVLRAAKNDALEEEANQRTTPVSGEPELAAAAAGSDSDDEPAEPDAKPADARSNGHPTITSTTALAPLAGHMTKGQAQIGVVGTDLGFSFVHQGKLRFMFGDTWSKNDATLIDPTSDDIEGFVSLSDFPNGRAVDDYVRAHPATSGPAWNAIAPPITFSLDAQGRVSPIQLQRDGTVVAMSVGKTPSAGFSNGRDVFAFFHRWIPVQCSGGAAPSCADGYACDTGLGTFLGATDGISSPCLLTDAGCGRVAGAGLCQDRTSPTYSNDDWGRKQSVVLRDEFGNLDRSDPTRYLTHSVDGLKFRNRTLCTVADFDPSRIDGAGDDYRAAPGRGARQEKVLMWGRPVFGASAARGGNAKLYFSYLDMPEYSETGDVAVTTHYFTGLSGGVPQFSDRMIDAAPLDLSYPGADPTRETWDIVNQMTISWVDSIGKWVMLYGGDLAPTALPIVVGPDARLQPDPEGAIHLRYADRPWGPWSPPTQALKAVDRANPAVGAAADGGILRSPSCSGAACAPHEPGYSDSETGMLYGAAIIDPWTSAHDDGSVDLYWAVSTWDPYQVVLLKSRLEMR